MNRLIILVGLAASLTAAGCSGSGGTTTPERDYTARIVRTTYGIPHITGSDWGNLGYGQGYAYAQDNFCTLMREIVAANGEAARYFGEDFENDDYLYRWINSDERIETEFLAGASDDIRDLARGFAAGFNRHLEDTGVDNLAEGDEGCRGAEWVRPITELDVAKRLNKLILRAGLGLKQGSLVMANFIVAASDAAPTQSMALAPTSGPQSASIEGPWFEPEEQPRLGSNAYGIGSAGSQTDYGILLGNPHFPWAGPERFYFHHLTVPGVYDMMGASLHGVPLILIGFNKDMAWSHTVSTAQRFTLYELELVEGDPFSYRYDDEIRAIDSVPVTVEVMLEDDTVEERTKNIYLSQYGPVLELGALSELVGGWPTPGGTVFTIRDANLNNTRILEQFVGMGQATSIEEFEEALKDIGIPWANTIAADRNGTGFYGDVTTVPHVTQEKLQTCAEGFSVVVTNLGIASLNGSRSDCEWGTDEDGPEGLLGYENLPKIRTSESVPYVGNANDSYWLSSPEQLLTGFSPLMGRNGFDPPEGIQQSTRTRQTFSQADERLAATDGLSETPGFNVELLQQVMQSSRNYPGELIRNDVKAICDGVVDWTGGDCNGEMVDAQPYSENPTEAAAACAILGDWDGRFNNDSVGASVWNEFWRRFNGGGFWNRASGGAERWAVPFDAADPVDTPNTLNDEDPDVVEGVRCAIGNGVDFLINGGVPIDRAWGQVQYRWSADRTEQIPIHGGSGMFNNIGAGFVQDEGYSNIGGGNSYVQTVTWNESECPDAYAVLTYSLSTDPASDHYDDQTRIWSAKQWNDVPFCQDDIDAEMISDMEISTTDN